MVRIRPARLAAVALVAMAAAVMTWADSAGACSCANRDERDRLEEGEIGVLGKVLEARTLERTVAGQRLVSAYEYLLRVERGVGARFGSAAVVRVPADGCEPAPTEVGQRLAAFVRERRFGWLTHGCSLADPANFERALLPYPRARGHGRLALLAGGSFGTARTIALDARGRILGYGFGGGEVQNISVCPGSERTVEMVASRGRFSLAVRDLHSLELLWSTALPMRATDISPDRAVVHCADPGAAAVYAGVRDYIRKTRFDRTRIFSATASGTGLIATLHGYAVAFGNGVAFVGDSKRLASVDLSTGVARRLTRVRFPQLLAASPDGRWLAVYDRDKLRLIDLAGGGERVLTVQYGGAIAWLSDDRFLFRRGGEGRVYDTELKLRRRYPFFRLLGEAHHGDRLFGMAGFELRSLDLSTGSRRSVAQLPDRGILELVGVPDSPPVSADRSPPGLGFPAVARGAEGCRSPARG
jgi:hypothetical protein